MSSIICKVTGDKKLSQQYVLSLPFLLASFHPSNALRSAIWSLHQRESPNSHSAIRLLDQNLEREEIVHCHKKRDCGTQFEDLTYKNPQQMIFLQHQLPLSYLLEEQMGLDVQVQKQLLTQDQDIEK